MLMAKQDEVSLQKKLRPRHISFMAMGGVIGTGYLKEVRDDQSRMVRRNFLLYLCRTSASGGYGSNDGNGYGVSGSEHERLCTGSLWKTGFFCHRLDVLFHVAVGMRD